MRTYEEQEIKNLIANVNSKKELRELQPSLYNWLAKRKLIKQYTAHLSNDHKGSEEKYTDKEILAEMSKFTNQQDFQKSSKMFGTAYQRGLLTNYNWLHNTPFIIVKDINLVLIQIKDLPYYINCQAQIFNHKGQEMTHVQNANGYFKVTLTYPDGTTKGHYVHKLVLEAFVGDCPEGYVADHIDFDTSNNTLANVRYITVEENLARSKENRREAKRKITDEEIILFKKYINGIRNIKKPDLVGYSKRTGISYNILYGIYTNRTWTDIN